MFADLGGTVEDIQGLKCHIPPEGYVAVGEALEFRGVYKRSPNAKDQYWEAITLPSDYGQRRKREEEIQKGNKEFFDIDLEQIRQREWDRRLNGFWFYNNGKATYITGLHYFYLNYWNIDVGLPKYRDTDRKYFYFLQYCMEDPECMGVCEITKRRNGKTYRGGVFLYDYASRTGQARSGIQSKTGGDAKEVFRKAVIQPFKKLPHFFRPTYDTSKGLTPTSELRFYNTVVKGKKAEEILDGEELESMVDWKPSDAISYDGQKLHRYLVDEIGKTTEVDVWRRWLVTYYCLLDDEGKIIGKALATTTVEEMDQGGEAFKNIWKNSDHTNKTGKRTVSGLYRFFTPADETRYYDQYGYADKARALAEILEERKQLSHDTRALSSKIRKEPLSWEEAFRVDGDRCLYDAYKINERMDVVSWQENLTTRGNFVWQDGVRDSKVLFEPNKSGRWEVCWLPDEAEANRVTKQGDFFIPQNGTRFAIGIDPIDHNVTEDGRRSNGAAVVIRKHSAQNSEKDPYNFAPVCTYVYRPDTVSVFYEDMIKMAFFYGSPVLFENNKIGIMHYFNDRNYGGFLMWLPDRAQAGIAASTKTHQEIAELHEEYVSNHCDKIFFKDLLTDLLEFRLDNTTRFDLAMAFGYALIADRSRLIRPNAEKIYDVSEFYRSRKVAW